MYLIDRRVVDPLSLRIFIKCKKESVHKMVERVLSNHSLMGTISQEILTFPFHDTILGINRQTWNGKVSEIGQ